MKEMGVKTNYHAYQFHIKEDGTYTLNCKYGYKRRENLIGTEIIRNYKNGT